MIRAALETIAATRWWDWLACLAEFAGVTVIIVSVGLICIGFTPDGTPQEPRP